jgi:hypothetical protein
MKKHLTYLLLIIILFIGCKSENKCIEDTYETIVQLDNELGSIKIRLPKSLDTNKKTLHFSDFSCGDYVNFIFYNKKNNFLIPDTTWEFDSYPTLDSVEMLSLCIGQNMHPNCDTSSKSIDESYLEAIVERQLIINHNTVILEKELVDKENGQMAIIMYSIKTKSKKTIKNIDAFIMVKNQIVSISSSQIYLNNDSISAILYDCIKSMEIEE